MTTTLTMFGNPKGACPDYFRTFISLRRSVKDDGEWIVLSFDEGGQIRVPIDSKKVCIIVEPERH